MREFFKPWRRKLGSLGFVVACVFAAGWVRSPYVTDAVTYSTGENSVASWFSDNSTLGLIQYRAELDDGSGKYSPGTVSIKGPSYPTWITVRPGESDLSFLTWQWRWLGFGFSETEKFDGVWLTYRVAPYWSITLPLTLLSAYMLLSKPRSKPNQPVSQC